jgi:hypothetical protein
MRIDLILQRKPRKLWSATLPAFPSLFSALFGPDNVDSRSQRSHSAAMSNSLARAAGQGRKPPPPRPIPQDIVDNGDRYSLVQKIQCLALITEHFSAAEIERKTGVKQRTQSNIKKKAFERGFRPDVDPRILEYYLIDGERSRRPKEIKEDIEGNILANIRGSRSDGEKSSEVLACEARISSLSALRILRKHNFHSVKPITRCGLTPAMRAARLEFCLAHQDWNSSSGKM